MTAEALPNAAGFVQQLAQDLTKGELDLPMFPNSVIRIQHAFQSDDTDLDEIIRIISSDPALAARVLQLSNSAALRGADEITDLRQAVVRMGRDLLRSSAVAYALRQAERNDSLTASAKTALKAIWIESVELAAHCHVIAKGFTKLRPDEALLTGLLSVLGRLYILMKSQDFDSIDYADFEQILVDWHPAISKAIAESWGMSEELVTALECQLEPNPELKDGASLTEVLVAAKLIVAHKASGSVLDGSRYPLLQRLGIATASELLVNFAAQEEAINAVRRGLVN